MSGTPEPHATMHGYYAEQALLPTHGDFRTEADLSAYEQERRQIFLNRLGLPPAAFRGARLLEFGPDAGENSLVFALWGANCTLVEPNPKAHGVIRGYFERFGLAERLSHLDGRDLENFPSPADPAELYDIVDAEGFLNAVQPQTMWVKSLAELVRPDGLIIVFYNESFGGLLELVWKVVYARFQALTGYSRSDAARQVFEAKWASIPHKRSIDSWTMDVLENPFVRLRYFVDPLALCQDAADAGLVLHSSWPRYDGGLDVEWFKRPVSREESLERQIDYIRRSRISHMLGRRHFLIEDPLKPEEDLRDLAADIDALIDGFRVDVAERCDQRLARVEKLIASPGVLSTPAGRERSMDTLAMLRRLMEVLGEGEAGAIRRFCSENEDFKTSWGTPSHFAVLRR